MLARIFPLIAADPACTALLGTGHVRFYPFGKAPFGVEYPYAVWRRITGSPENYIGDLPDMDGYTLQIDIYAQTDASVRAVAKAMRDAIEPRAHIVRWGDEGEDPETKSLHIDFDVDWYESR